MRDATIEIVSNVIKHPNADRLDICTVLGYQCVTKRDQFKVGDRVVYVRPDSVFPDSDWAQEYKKYSKDRIKSIKIRGEWSEGVILPISILNNVGKIVE
jgi:RNA ligase (TIGR02306 family)